MKILKKMFWVADSEKMFELIPRSLFFGCLMSQVNIWDGFWLDDFSVSGTFLLGAFFLRPFFCLRRLFAYKLILEPIVAWFERKKA